MTSHSLPSGCCGVLKGWANAACSGFRVRRGTVRKHRTAVQRSNGFPLCGSILEPAWGIGRQVEGPPWWMISIALTALAPWAAFLSW